MEAFFITVRAVFFAGCFTWLWAWVALRLDAFDRGRAAALPEWTTAPGTGLMAAGAIVVISCIGVFILRGRGTPAPFDAPAQFVAVGPYRWVRNPMYIGAWMLLAGYSLLLHSPSAALFSLIWIVVVHLFVVFLEEPGLGADSARLTRNTVERSRAGSRNFERLKDLVPDAALSNCRCPPIHKPAGSLAGLRKMIHEEHEGSRRICVAYFV